MVCLLTKYSKFLMFLDIDSFQTIWKKNNRFTQSQKRVKALQTKCLRKHGVCSAVFTSVIVFIDFNLFAFLIFVFIPLRVGSAIRIFLLHLSLTLTTVYVPISSLITSTHFFFSFSPGLFPLFFLLLLHLSS